MRVRGRRACSGTVRLHYAQALAVSSQACSCKARYSTYRMQAQGLPAPPSSSLLSWASRTSSPSPPLAQSTAFDPVVNAPVPCRHALPLQAPISSVPSVKAALHPVVRATSAMPHRQAPRDMTSSERATRLACPPRRHPPTATPAPTNGRPASGMHTRVVPSPSAADLCPQAQRAPDGAAGPWMGPAG